LDLGVTAASLVTTPSLNVTISGATDANFASFVTSGDTLVYQLEGYTSGHTFIGTTTNSVGQATDTVAQLGTAASGINAEVGSYQGANKGVTTGSSIWESSLPNPTFSGTNANTQQPSTVQAVGTSIDIWNSYYTTSPTTVHSVDFATVDLTISGAGTAAVGTLTVGAASAVPLPTSVWMFLSGVVGLLSVKRRKAA